MFSKSQTSNLANGILEDQLHKDEASATLAAVRIGHAIYSCLYNIDHDGHSFVTRTSDEEAERVSAWSRTLADQLAPAAPLLGLLAERRLEGRDEAIQFACDGGYPPIPSGAPGVVIDSHVRARRIAGRFLSTLKDRGLELSNDSWPRRVVELAKVKGESANAAFEVVIGLRRDLELLSAFYDCIITSQNHIANGEDGEVVGSGTNTIDGSPSNRCLQNASAAVTQSRRRLP